jgi:hypothetical protein
MLSGVVNANLEATLTLLGMALLEGHELRITVQDEGAVSVKKLA